MKIQSAMKKLIAALLCVALSVGMGACSSSNPASSGAAGENSQTEGQSSNTESQASTGGKTLTFLMSIGNYEGQYLSLIHILNEPSVQKLLYPNR